MKTVTTNEKIQHIIDKIDGATTMERKVRILSMEFYGWRVSVTACSWEPGEIRITETEDTCFMGDPRMIQVNINDLDHIAELLSVLGDIDYRVIEAAKKACLAEKLDSIGFRFLKPMDWSTCIQRWTKLHDWVKRWFPKYPNFGWDWDPAIPKNFLNWAARTYLGNIKPSRIFLDNINKDIIEIQENGIANWKKDSGYWSEFCFRTDDEMRQSFGWGGQMSVAIQRVFSSKKDSPIGNYNKIPEQWEVDSHYFQRVIEPKGRKTKTKIKSKERKRRNKMKINAEMVRAYMPDRTYVETSGNVIKINDRKTGGAIFVCPNNNIIFEADDVREDIRVMLRVLCKASH